MPAPLPEPDRSPAAARPHARRGRALPRAALGDHPLPAPGPGGVRLAPHRGLRARWPTPPDSRPRCASRWPLLRHVPAAPTGPHEVCVCTNVSCALVGAGDTLREFERELGINAGETTAGRPDHAAHGRVLRRLRLGPGGVGRRALPRAVPGPRRCPALIAELRGEARMSADRRSCSTSRATAATSTPTRRPAATPQLRKALDDGAGRRSSRWSTARASAAAAAPASPPAARRRSCPRTESPPTCA